MATIKKWSVFSEAKHASGSTYEEETTVEAHQLTVEPGGALTFWAVTQDNMQAVLMFAFAAHAWTRIVVRSKLDQDPAKP